MAEENLLHEKPTEGTQDTTELERLVAERTAALQEELAQVRAEANKRIKQLERKSTGNPVADYVAKEKASEDQEDEERRALGKLFGKTSDANKANTLAKADPGLYKQLRHRAVELKLVDDFTPSKKY